MSEPNIPHALFQCDGAAVPPAWQDSSWDHRHSLNYRDGDGELNLRIDHISHRLHAAIGGRALDLLRIAAYVYVADQSISRGGVADVFGRKWERHMALAVPVTEPDFWANPTTVAQLAGILRFLSDDVWEFHFTQARQHFQEVSLFEEYAAELYGTPDSVVLFSGGADSLCAAVEKVLQQQRRPLLVSHRSNPVPYHRQVELSRAFRTAAPGWSLPQVSIEVNRRGRDPAETSQRTRAFLFASLGTIVAERLGIRDVYFSDNGVVSINLPISAGLYGAQATRSTHPRFIAEFNHFAERIFGAPLRVQNSLWSRTRADTLGILRATGTEELFRYTASCAHPRGRSKEQPHCGLCSQCIDRRFATIAAGLEAQDPADGYQTDIFLDNIPEGIHRLMAVGYYNLALRLHETAVPDILTEFPRLWDCLMYTEGSPEQAADTLARLLKRHGDTVFAVMKQQIKATDELIARRRLPRNSLIRLIQGLGSSASVASAPEAASQAAQPAPRDAQTAGQFVFRQDGEYYTLTFDGITVRMKQRDGLAYIREMLANPQKDIPVEKLHRQFGSRMHAPEQPPVQIAVSGQEVAAAGMHVENLNAPDHSLDRPAAAAIRRRIRDLQEELNEATRNNDPERRRRAEEQLEQLARRFARGKGLGGRDRLRSDPVKRDRDAVSKAVKHVIRDIRRVHKALGHHLQNTIHTGSYCQYSPEEQIPWTL